MIQSSSKVILSHFSRKSSHLGSTDNNSEQILPSPLLNMDFDASPIRPVKTSSLHLLSPEFRINRRQRTSTRIVSPKTPQNQPILSSLSLSSRRKRNHSLSSEDSDSDDLGRHSPEEMKRIRVSDLSLSRYEEEFLELSEVASGEFGCVALARHRLDGSDYAVKVSKNKLKPGSYEEKKALNEVLAHATLNSNEHVVKHFDSWVEDGQVFIQNEFCQGGSLSEKIAEKRVSGQKFSEEELKKILRQSLMGLQYIHSKQMVHLDIKPENIFISKPMNGSEDEEVVYKLGDLGHAYSMNSGNISPEEGDCRYMAPEFLLMELDHSLLHKADIFSLGLSMYEAASLRTLPRNSIEDEEYIKLKAGQLPDLPGCSEQFNTTLATMVSHRQGERPSTQELLGNSLLA